MDLEQSIKDGQKAVEDINDVCGDLEGVVCADMCSKLRAAANELGEYLLADAAIAKDRIHELETQLAEVSA